MIHTNGYWHSPWPCEDGGARRMQIPHGIDGVNIKPGEKLQITKRRLIAPTMIVLRAPGEVYLLRHTVYRKFIGLPTSACVERIHPESLATMEKSQQLPGGPFW